METRLFAFIFHITPAFFAHGENNFAQKVFQILLSARRWFWKSFPKMTVDVDSMVIVSRSLGALPDSVLSQLPGDADSLNPPECAALSRNRI